MKWLFVELVVETDTVKNTNIELVNADFWKNEMGSNPERATS